MATTPHDIYSVSDLNLAVRSVLDEAFAAMWIKGEISNFTQPRSGHWYFTLKDEKAQVRCAMFRGLQSKVGFIPKDGLEILVFAKVGLYPERGDYQLIVEKLESSGEGTLKKAFEALKLKLKAEGLFEKEHKQALPAYPKRVGVITSPTGAAIRDILSVLKRRFPALEVIIYPCVVQGIEAPKSIQEAIEKANEQASSDVLILARGGGSLEDLWGFNDERVAYAIYNSTIPIVSGVGHETDFTIADYVADLRAPTPSVAAEYVSPDGEALFQSFLAFETHLNKCMLRLLQDLGQTLDHLEKRLVDPIKRLKQLESQLKQILQRLKFALKQTLKAQKTDYRHAVWQLKGTHIIQRIQADKQTLIKHLMCLNQSVGKQNAELQARFGEALRTLEAVSPMATLSRGYSMTFKGDQVVTEVHDVKIGDKIRTQLNTGVIHSKVNEIDP